MPDIPITYAERVNAIIGALGMSLVILAVASLLHFLISKKSVRKKIQGQPIRWWAAFLYFIGAALGTWVADNHRYHLREVVGGMGGFGLLLGVAIGNIHGAWRWHRATESTRLREEEPNPAGQVNSSRSENPYSPPDSR